MSYFRHPKSFGGAPRIILIPRDHSSRPGERINYGWGNYMEAATPRPVRHSPEPGNYGSGVRHMSPARLFGLLE